jgi:hypothetical protein
LNKALIDTDVLSEIGKARDATVAANAKTYRRSFGHFTCSPCGHQPSEHPVPLDSPPGLAKASRRGILDV